MRVSKREEWRCLGIDRAIDGGGELNCPIRVGCRWPEGPAEGFAIKPTSAGWPEVVTFAIVINRVWRLPPRIPYPAGGQIALRQLVPCVAHCHSVKAMPCSEPNPRRRVSWPQPLAGISIPVWPARPQACPVLGHRVQPPATLGSSPASFQIPALSAICYPLLLQDRVCWCGGVDGGECRGRWRDRAGSGAFR